MANLTLLARRRPYAAAPFEGEWDEEAFPIVAPDGAGMEAPEPTTQMTPPLSFPTMAPPRHPSLVRLENLDREIETASQPRKVGLGRNILATILGGLTALPFGGAAGRAVRQGITGESARRRNLADLYQRRSMLGEEMSAEEKVAKGEAERRHLEAQTREAQARAGLYGAQADAARMPVSPVAKKIDEFTDPEGNRVLVMQRPDGSTYNSVAGKVQQNKPSELSGTAKELAGLLGRTPTLKEMLDYERQLSEARRDPDAGTRGQFVTLTDEQGRVIGAWNPKTRKVEPVPEELAGARRGGLSETALQQRTMLQNMLEDTATITGYRKEGKLSDWDLGPIAGRATALGHAVAFGDEPTIESYRIVDNLSDQLLRARSGAQINEQEYQRLRNLVPNKTDKPDVFDVKLKSFRNELQRTIARRTGQKSVNEQGGAQQQQPAKAAPAKGAMPPGWK